MNNIHWNHYNNLLIQISRHFEPPNPVPDTIPVGRERGNNTNPGLDPAADLQNCVRGVYGVEQQ